MEQLRDDFPHLFNESHNPDLCRVFDTFLKTGEGRRDLTMLVEQSGNPSFVRSFTDLLPAIYKVVNLPEIRDNRAAVAEILCYHKFINHSDLHPWMRPILRTFAFIAIGRNPQAYADILEKQVYESLYLTWTCTPPLVNYNNKAYITEEMAKMPIDVLTKDGASLNQALDEAEVRRAYLDRCLAFVKLYVDHPNPNVSNTAQDILNKNKNAEALSVSYFEKIDPPAPAPAPTPVLSEVFEEPPAYVMINRTKYRPIAPGGFTCPRTGDTTYTFVMPLPDAQEYNMTIKASRPLILRRIFDECGTVTVSSIVTANCSSVYTPVPGCKAQTVEVVVPRN